MILLFLTRAQNLLPLQPVITEEAGQCGPSPKCGPGDAPLLQFSKSGGRRLLRTGMWICYGAPIRSPGSYRAGTQGYRRAAPDAAGTSDRSLFETVSEIRIGATEADPTDSGLVQVTQFNHVCRAAVLSTLCTSRQGIAGSQIYRGWPVQRCLADTHMQSWFGGFWRQRDVPRRVFDSLQDTDMVIERLVNRESV